MEPPPAKSPSKLQLITPSASPPPPAHAYRSSASVTPSTRQRDSRLASTPRRTMSETSSSSCRPQSSEDVDRERRASTNRLLNIWASLEERYCRPLDEDDIIDIQTGEIIKDNGFLRSYGKVDFGAIIAPTAEDVAADGFGDVYEEGEHEYDTDELDSFVQANAEAEESEPSEQRIAEYLGNVKPLSYQPGLEDLREFMDAELHRRKLYGSDIDDEEDDYHPAEDIYSDSESESEPEIAREDHEEEEDHGEGHVEHMQLRTDDLSRDIDQSASPSPSSEDELDNWDLGEASLVFPVAKNESPEDSSSDVEVIENPAAIGSSVSTDASQARKSREKSHHLLPQIPQTQSIQLCTPPQSQSSVIRFNTPGSARPTDSPRDYPSISASSSKIPRTVSRIVNDNTANDKSLPVNSTERCGPPTSPQKLSRPKPYVLLTPRKTLYKQKEYDFSPTKDIKGKGKPKERDETRHRRESFDSGIEYCSPRTVHGGRSEARLRGSQVASSHSKHKKEMAISVERQSKSWNPISDELYRRPTAPDDGYIHPQETTFHTREPTPSPRKRKRSETSDFLGISMPRQKNTERLSPVSTPLVPKIRRASNQASTSEIPVKKGQSSRGRDGSPRSESGTESESYSSESEAGNCFHSDEPNHHAGMQTIPVPQPHYTYPYSPYIQSPLEYPPYANLQAQQFISAVQQLSALLHTPWPAHPDFLGPSVQRAPSRDRHSVRREIDPFSTPKHHPHPSPYVYDPNLSHATLPPASPEIDSSPEKPFPVHRKSLVGRSRSRGRHVSFVVGKERPLDPEVHSARRGMRSPKDAARKGLREHETEGDWLTSPRRKGKQKKASSDRKDWLIEDVDSNSGGPRREYMRAQTPGPGTGGVVSEQRRT